MSGLKDFSDTPNRDKDGTDFVTTGRFNESNRFIWKQIRILAKCHARFAGAIGMWLFTLTVVEIAIILYLIWRI